MIFADVFMGLVYLQGITLIVIQGMVLWGVTEGPHWLPSGG